MLRRVRVAVIGDPHFCNERPVGTGSEPSHIVVQRLQIGSNPWTDLKKLVSSEHLQVQYLLCAGDITTHAAKRPLEVAWHELVDLGRALKAKVTACCTGNHDVSSRHKPDGRNLVEVLENPPDLFENLKCLEPEYPLHTHESGASKAGRQRRVDYFGADFVIHEDEDVRLIVFNSCARHTTESETYERGKISKSTLAELKAELSARSDSKINIFLCHHCPGLHSQEGGSSYDFIQHGDLLLEELEAHGDWIVIHGHKHEGRIRYAPSASAGSAPVLFSASSLGSFLSHEQLAKYRNQFYVLDIELPPARAPRARVSVWNWHAGSGWVKAADPQAGLVDGVGFGVRAHPHEIAEEVAIAIATDTRTWPSLVETLPFLGYLTTDDLTRVIKRLEQSHSLVVLRDNYGSVIEIGPGALS